MNESDRAQSGDLTSAVAATLRAEMARRQVPLQHVVNVSGLSRSSVNRYLNEGREIPLPALFKMCRAIGIEPSEVLRLAEGGAAQAVPRPSAETLGDVIAADPTLSKAAKQHLINQYGLLQLASKASPEEPEKRQGRAGKRGA